MGVCVEGVKVAFRKASNSCPQEPVKVTLLGKRVFADIIKLRILRQYYPRRKVSPKSNDRCPNKRRPVIQKGAV